MRQIGTGNNQKWIASESSQKWFRYFIGLTSEF
jgi:hypothetical protein